MATISSTPPYPVEDSIKYDLAMLSFSGIRTQILYSEYFSHVPSALRAPQILCVGIKHLNLHMFGFSYNV